MIAQAKGIVLKASRYGEADLIVSLLTTEGARLQLFARSALKSKKRFGGGVLEPTRYIQVSFEDRRSRLGGESDLHSLREAVLLEAFEGIRNDYSRIETALALVQSVHRIVRQGDVESAEIFNLLGNSLRAIETSNDLAKLRVHFDIRLLASQGVLEIEGDSARLAGMPVGHHGCEELTNLDWRGLGQYATQQLRRYTESGSVE
ncbi:MAG: DNA repair protein RecO [Bdellovibrionales bacterium]|jgi:DNA repair protein RecO (recombination protein O)|nr:DNA repair protein RecO [Bdellovibrionales bacterium]